MVINSCYSLAMSLTSLPLATDWTELGSMLFLRNVSGTRYIHVLL